MGILAGSIFRIVLQVAAGMGVMNLLDTFIKPKVGPVVYPETISPGFKVPKIFWFVGAFVVAILALRFLGKQFKIQLLKDKVWKPLNCY